MDDEYEYIESEYRRSAPRTPSPKAAKPPGLTRNGSWCSIIKPSAYHHKLEVHYHENWSHGWLLFRPSEQEKLITKIQIMALASKSASAAVNNSSTHNSQKSFGSPTASTVPSSPRHRRTHSMHERLSSSSIKLKDSDGKEEEGSGGESMMMMRMMLPTVGSTPSTLDALHEMECSATTTTNAHTTTAEQPTSSAGMRRSVHFSPSTLALDRLAEEMEEEEMGGVGGPCCGGGKQGDVREDDTTSIGSSDTTDSAARSQPHTGANGAGGMRRSSREPEDLDDDEEAENGVLYTSDGNGIMRRSPRPSHDGSADDADDEHEEQQSGVGIEMEVVVPPTHPRRERRTSRESVEGYDGLVRERRERNSRESEDDGRESEATCMEEEEVDGGEYATYLHDDDDDEEEEEDVDSNDENVRGVVRGYKDWSVGHTRIRHHHGMHDA